VKKLKEKTALFLFGGLGYGSLEILARGFTHWSMVLAGGFCLLLMARISARLAGRGLLWQALCAAAAVTAVELAVGLVVNCWLGLGVWDYSGQPLDLLGQICPLYSFFWFLLSLPVLTLLRRPPAADAP